MADRTYLDWNATSPLRPEARAAMLAAADLVGNPSSIHAEGRAARRVVEEARERVAALVGADPRNVVFTSGGTEANALALTPAIRVGEDAAPRDRLLVSAVEHASVRAGGRFDPRLAEEFPATSAGTVDLDALRQRLVSLAGEGARRPLVSIMHANNETGVIQPIAEAAKIVHDTGGLLHVDAVQSAGKIRCDIGALGADLVTISAHKMGGPKGVGALIKSSDAIHLADPVLKGGGQERGARAGTENIAGIVGFGAAAQAAASTLAREAARMLALRSRLEAGLAEISPSAVIFGAAAERLPNTTLFASPGAKAEIALIALDLAGVAVSSGSACSSGKVAPSHVLKSMGVPPELSNGAIRVSIGFSTGESDIEAFLGAWNSFSRALPKGRENIAA